MKWLNCKKMKLMLFVFVAAIVLYGGRANADFTMSEPVNLGPVINDNTDMQEGDLSHDGLEFYFSALRTNGYGMNDIWVSKRETLNSPWQEPVNLGLNVNGSETEIEPTISGDGLELYLGYWDDYILRVCTRLSKDAPWSSPVKVGPPVGSDDAWAADISADGLSLYFSSTRVGGYGVTDIWVATRATVDDPWGEPANLGPNVNTSTSDWSPCISTEGLTLVFTRASPSGVWATTRRSVDDDWGPAVQLAIPSGIVHGATLSPDGSTLYLEAYSSWGGYGSGDYWQVTFTPVVDFNGDGYVDILDLVVMVNNWGTDNTLCDICPTPLGDGIVDDEDLFALMSYWGDDVNDPTLMTNYKLDEAQGDIAYDSAGILDGILYGNPTWQPVGGIVNGALEFDGIDDFISAPFILNPGETSAFSVFAWIKGGLPGQTIISQTDGLNWLAADSAEGCLMTDLKAPTRAGKELLSQVYITDEQWHRIGLVWDGSERILYVDDIEATRDAQTVGLTGCEGGLYIGAGSDLEPGSFFCGLIDDVRIYNRAITP